MAYYVRKISRAKWTIQDVSLEKKLENCSAEAITNDIQAKGNEISVWKAEDLSPKSMEPVIVINSLLGDTMSKIELITIPEEMLEDFDINQEDGDTVVKNFRYLHYNIVNLTVKKHLQFANDVMLKIIIEMEEEEKNRKLGVEDPEYQKLIRRYTTSEQKPLIQKWIRNGEVKIDDIEQEMEIKKEENLKKNGQKLQTIRKWIGEI